MARPEHDLQARHPRPAPRTAWRLARARPNSPRKPFGLPPQRPLSRRPRRPRVRPHRRPQSRASRGPQAHRQLGRRRASFHGRRGRVFPAHGPPHRAPVRLLGQRPGPRSRTVATNPLVQPVKPDKFHPRRAQPRRHRPRRASPHRGHHRRAQPSRAPCLPHRAAPRRPRHRRRGARRARRVRLRPPARHRPVRRPKVPSRVARRVRSQAASTSDRRVPTSVVRPPARHLALAPRVRAAPARVLRPPARIGPVPERRPRAVNARGLQRPVAFRAPYPDRGAAPAAHRVPATTRSRRLRAWARVVVRAPGRTPPVREVRGHRPVVRPAALPAVRVPVGSQGCRVRTRP